MAASWPANIGISCRLQVIVCQENFWNPRRASETVSTRLTLTLHLPDYHTILVYRAIDQVRIIVSYRKNNIVKIMITGGLI